MKSLWLCAATAALLVGAAHAEDLVKPPTYGTWGLDLTAGVVLRRLPASLSDLTDLTGLAV